MTSDFGDLNDSNVSHDSSTAHKVSAFMERHGLPKHKRVAYLATVLHLDRALIYRRMKDDPEWSMGELQLIATHFKVGVNDILQATSAHGAHPVESSKEVGNKMARAKLCFKLDPSGVSIEFATGADAARAQFVAVETGDEWNVYPRAKAPAGKTSRPVRRIVLDVLEPDTVAILEDEPAIAALLKESLEKAGMAAQVFATADSLSAAVLNKPFNAYICDWYLKSQTSAEVVTRIRRLQPGAPIVITTGKIDEAGQASLIDFTNRLELDLIPKPYRPPIVANALRRNLQRLPR